MTDNFQALQLRHSPPARRTRRAPLLRYPAVLLGLLLFLAACTSAPATVGQPLSSATPTSGRTPAGPPPAAETPAATRPPGDSFYYRLEVRRTWTQATAGGNPSYALEVAICNQTPDPREVRLAALTVIVRPRGRPGAVGYGLKPESLPEGGLPATLSVAPGACATGAVSITPPPTEIPDTLWYRSGDGREAAAPVTLHYPE